MSKDKVFFATGDIGMSRKDPDSIFNGVRDLLKEGDLIFGQLEPCLSNAGYPASQTRLPMRTDPESAKAIRKAGYDVISFASNHCMDWGKEAFFDTIKAVNGNNMQILGVGSNIDEARKPVIIDLDGTKIGFLGYNTILPQNYFATKDRPGCNPMRGLTVYEQIELDQPGTPCRIHTFPLKSDLDDMIKDIEQIRDKVDILMMSFHWGIHFVPAVIADYQRVVAHAAIDAGADIILGHHSHILKPIEIYNDKVIFYSLANFALDPPQAFDKNLLEKDSHKELVSLNKDWKKSKGSMPPDSYKTILGKCIIGDKKIKSVSFLPIHIDPDSNPFSLTRNDKEFGEIVSYLEEISEDQGLKLVYTIEGNELKLI